MVPTLRKERCDGVVLCLRITGVVEGEAEELRLFSRRPHQRRERGLPAHNLFFNLFNWEPVNIRVRVSMIAEIVTLRYPLFEYASTRGRTDSLNAFFDHKARNRNMAFGKCRQQPVVGRLWHVPGKIDDGTSIRKVIHSNCNRAALAKCDRRRKKRQYNR